MPKIRLNELDTYYEQSGEGPALVFVHGAFADERLWEPQWKYFSTKYRLLRYDLRGHGRTGVSSLAHYSITTFAEDLTCLLDALGHRSLVVCGLSWGGSIAQAFAVRNPGRLKGLILAGSAVAIDLTLVDKLLCRVIFPWWAMKLTIRTLSVENFTDFSLWLGRLARGRHWLSRDEGTQQYLEQCMLGMDGGEYLKIWEAIYNFRLLPIERISCPTLVLNGEHEPKGTFRHTREILRRVPHAEAGLIPHASHAMNLEEPGAFNQLVEDFLPRCA
jgi:3-oxoadipate enol-lactonase